MEIKQEIIDYVYLSKLFGSCIDFVQATGGNISVKTDTDIIIKKSGTSMAETTDSKGYLACSLSKLNDSSCMLESTILYGDLPGKPSMELFFHMLPPKYIVHIHPTAFMKELCSEGFGTLKNDFPSALFVPYLPPGKLLGGFISQSYSSQSIIFLANHGVIFLSDTIPNLLDLVVSSFLKLGKPFSDILFLDMLYKTLGHQFFIKPSILLHGTSKHITLPKYTPDYHLFLDSEVCDYKSKDSLQTFIQRHGKVPSILYYNAVYYIISSTSTSANHIEQLFYSYVISNFTDDCVSIGEVEKRALENDPNEINRITLFKAN